MKNLLIKLQNKRKEEKGFTLVELLVVIAILAILASVSVVGYMGFTTKAKDSNAVTELKQVQTVVTSDLLYEDGTHFKYVVSNKDDESNHLYLLDTTDTATTNLTDKIKTDFEDLKNLKGTFTVEFSSNTATNVGGAATTDLEITYVSFARTEGGNAYWNVATGEIVAGTK